MHLDKCRNDDDDDAADDADDDDDNKKEIENDAHGISSRYKVYNKGLITLN